VKGIYEADLKVFAKFNYGDAVFMGSEVSGVQAVNGCTVGVVQALQCTGFAINNDVGYGNLFNLQEVQGSFLRGVIRFNVSA